MLLHKGSHDDLLNTFATPSSCPSLPLVTYIFAYIFSDINECVPDSNPCDENAVCINTDGSANCTCKRGFTGDGIICQGM